MTALLLALHCECDYAALIGCSRPRLLVRSSPNGFHEAVAGGGQAPVAYTEQAVEPYRLCYQIWSSTGRGKVECRLGRLASPIRSGSRSIRSTTHRPCHATLMLLVAVRRCENTAAS